MSLQFKSFHRNLISTEQLTHVLANTFTEHLIIHLTVTVHILYTVLQKFPLNRFSLATPRVLVKYTTYRKHNYEIYKAGMLFYPLQRIIIISYKDKKDCNFIKHGYIFLFSTKGF